MSLKKFWIIAQTLSEIIIIATTIFVDFYIWEITHNFQTLLSYNLSLFIALPVGVLIAGFLSEYVSHKVGYIFSKLIQISFLSLLLVMGPLLFSSITIFGLLAGLVAGISLSPEEVINFKLPGQEALPILTSISKGKKMVGLVIPPFFAYLIQQSSDSFSLPFIIAIGVSLIVLSLAPLVDFPESDSAFSLLTILTIPGTNPEKSLLIKASFLNGIKMGLHYSLIGVLTLSFVGSLIKWSYISVGLTLFSIVLVSFYRWLNVARHALLSLGLASVVFLIGSGYFAYDFSLLGIGIYLIGLSFFDIFFGFGYSSAVKRISQIDGSGKDLESEYVFLETFFSSLGMILPIAVLSYLKLDLEDPIIFQILIVIIGLLPFGILSLMKKSFYLTHETTAQTP